MARPKKLNNIIIEEPNAYIECKHGLVIIDLKNVNLINKYTWFTKKAITGSYYVYASTTINKKETKISLQRLLLGNPENKVIDHINGNTMDNRIENLRICSKSENNKNAKKNKRGTSSKYKGVTKRPSGRFGVYIQNNKVIFCVGTFDSEIEAAKAYNKKALELFGEYAKLNEIGE